MSACAALGAVGGSSGEGMASALRTLDCQTGETTAMAFGRLFGTHGQLLPALTAAMTLYVAFFAIGLLTGRTRVGVAALTPRMMTLGLVLTFATSWAAYQNVIWTLASGAPDQVATLLAGTHGSATTAFADRLDQLFAAIADAAHQATLPAPPTETGITPAAPTVAGFSASTVLWLAAILLLLGTAGVLVTSKIALAALLALGPLFIVFALFGGTRGLFDGWVKALVMFALVPLLAVLIGGGALGALGPVVRSIANEGGQPDPHKVGVLFMGACVYIALMIMVLKTAGTIIGGWKTLGPGRRQQRGEVAAAAAAGAARGTNMLTQPSIAGGRIPDERVRQMLSALPASHASEGGTVVAGSFATSRSRDVTRQIALAGPGGVALPARVIDHRLQGIRQGMSIRPRSAPKGYLS
ncbi:MAG: type IV secretion system protein [Sphingomicrobium sp.]|nr:type IV secretion system protein [Sphingomonadales bacterium]